MSSPDLPATQIRHTNHLSLVAGSILARISIWIFGCYAIGQGLGILTSPPERWTGPSFTVLVGAPGGYRTSGMVVTAAGVITIVGSLTRLWWLKTVGLVGVIAWSLCFSFGTFAATTTTPTAGITGGPVYLKDALLAAVLVLIHEKKAKS